MAEKDLGTANQELLKRIRQRYRYGMDKWRYNREEGQKNMRYVAGDPWTDEDKQARKGRPTLSADELNQYVNQVVNTARQNPRGIQIDPAGGDATEKLADYRENRIRAIEYACNASQVYVNGLQAATERNVGYWKVSREYVADDSDEQEILVLPVQNPDSVLIDPDFKELDGGDIRWAFELDRLPLEEFEREYPDAEIRSFAADDFGDDTSYWYDGKSILIASYWEVKTSTKKVGKAEREVAQRTVQQYVTNGVEILDKTKWLGSWIPIIAAMGQKVYKPVGNEMKRFYYSQIRRARGPQMMLAYGASQEAEVVGQLPRTPVIGYVGQFETDPGWKNLNNTPLAYIQADAVTDSTSGTVLPLPTRLNQGPDIAGYEAFNERWRRAIQSAMGQVSLPTAAQRQNEKSGVALDKIQTAQAVGSFHFTDNFDRAIENAGRQLDELITLVMDTPRQVTAKNPDDTHNLMHVAPGGKGAPTLDGITGQPVDPDDVFDPTKGDFDVTISTGPSFQSQRDTASAFADTLIGELGNLPITPQQKATLLALSIKLKDVGPIGDEIAKIVDPEGDGEPVPPQAQQMIAQLQQQLQNMQTALGQAGVKINDLEFDKKAQITKHSGDMELEKLKLENQLTIAEVTTQAQNLSERLEFVHDMVKQLHDQAHDSAMADQQAQQQQDLQAQQGQQQSDLQSQQQEAPNGE